MPNDVLKDARDQAGLYQPDPYRGQSQDYLLSIPALHVVQEVTPLHRSSEALGSKGIQYLQREPRGIKERSPEHPGSRRAPTRPW